MEYLLVEEFDPEELSKRVSQLLDEGWELHAGPALTAYYAKGDKDIVQRTIFAQAMVKRFKDGPLEDLDLSPRTLRALLGAGIKTAGQLSRLSVSEIISHKGVGKKALVEACKALAARGYPEPKDDLRE